MLSRIAIFILAAVILVIIIFVGYNFIKGVLNFRDKNITVTSDNQFDPTSLSVNNTDNVKVKNNSNEKQIIIDADTNKTLAEVDSKKTSKRLDLAENSTANLTLADHKQSSVVIIVGNPETNSEDLTDTPTPTVTPTATPKPTSSPTSPVSKSKTATSEATNGSKLPGTGAEDYIPLMLLLLGGVYLGRQARIYYRHSK